jgi:hypothetical protein
MILMLGALLAFSFVGFAQEASEITDEEMMKFAVVEDSINHTKALKTAEFNEALQSSELLNGGRLYVAIRDAKGDEAKLEELEVTEEIMAEYERIKTMYDAIAGDLVELKKSLVQDNDILGVSIYNKVMRAMREDAEFKGRVDALIAELGTKWQEKEEDTTEN